MLKSGFSSVLALTLVAALSSPAQAEGLPGAKSIGEIVPDSHSLRDLRGSGRPLHSFSKHKAVVLVFLGTECPISKLYIPSLVQMEKAYRSKNVQFLAVYPNEQEDLDQLCYASPTT